MEAALALLAAIIKYGDYAVQIGTIAAEALPKIIEYTRLAYSILFRSTPPTDDEKAKIDAALDEIDAILDSDIAAREAEAAALRASGTDLSGK